MVSRYCIDPNKVRAVSGISSSFISDKDFAQLIESAEYEAERIMNTVFIPTTRMELTNGDNSERYVVLKNPLLKVRALEIDTTTVTIDDIRWDKESGTIWLENTADKTQFLTKAGNKKLTKIKYDHGLLDNTTTQTTTSADATAGDTVSIEVADSDAFSVNDYVQIEGFDGYQETVKITAIADSTHITVDNIAVDHESGSLVTKVITPGIVIRFIEIMTAMMGVARIVGQSFDELTGYSIGELSVQKGEPYTQWREVTVQLRKEYDGILKALRQRPSVM